MWFGHAATCDALYDDSPTSVFKFLNFLGQADNDP